MITKSKTQAAVNPKSLTWKSVVAFIITLAVGLLGGGVFVSVTSDGEIVVTPTASIELAEEQVPTVIETEDGEIKVIEAPTVEEIDGNQLLDEEGDYGRGEYHDTSSPQAYKEATYGKCIDVDGHYGSQCFDLANDFWQNYAGRWLSSCGTGAAKGTLNCWEQNAGSDFEMVWEAKDLQAGDWAVFTNGVYGHIGMALGGYNNGYIALLGENQGGSSCSGGGSSTNIINISLKNFGGAFRPKAYIKQEPIEPSKPEVNKNVYEVKAGDTMSSIMLELEGKIEWGKTMDDYASHWVSTKVNPGQTVYAGWHSETGVGLYAGDIIEHRE